MGCDVAGARCDGNWWRSEPLAHRSVQCARLDCGGVEPTRRTCVGFERTNKWRSYVFHPPASCARTGFSRACRSPLGHRRRTRAIRHPHRRVHVGCIFPDRSPLQQMHPVSSCVPPPPPRTDRSRPRGCAIHTLCGGGSQAPPSLHRCFASSEKTSPSLLCHVRTHTNPGLTEG